MNLEMQLKENLKEREENRKRFIKSTTLFFAQAEDAIGPCESILSASEKTDEVWSPEARKVFAYSMDHSDLSTNKDSYKMLFHLVGKIESTNEIEKVGDHILWMTSFCLLAEDDEEVDFLLDRADKCEECRETHLLYTAQFLVMDQPMSVMAISQIIHNGFGPEFWGLIWCDLEGLADGMYWSEEPQDTPWRQLCRETDSDNVFEILSYVKKLKVRADSTAGKTTVTLQQNP
jgi:hypothetical protein